MGNNQAMQVGGGFRLESALAAVLIKLHRGVCRGGRHRWPVALDAAADGTSCMSATEACGREQGLCCAREGSR